MHDFYRVYNGTINKYREGEIYERVNSDMHGVDSINNIWIRLVEEQRAYLKALFLFASCMLLSTRKIQVI